MSYIYVALSLHKLKIFYKTQLKIAMSLRDIPLADADCQGQLN